MSIVKRNYTSIEKPSIMMIGIACRTSNAPDAGPQDIPRLWGKFYSENILTQIPNKASNEIIALYCDYEGDHTQPYTCVIGCPVLSFDEIPEGMVAKIIPDASYAIFEAKGEFPKNLIETWGEIWRTPLERTYSGDFEIYGAKSPQELEVCIAIEKR